MTLAQAMILAQLREARGIMVIVVDLGNGKYAIERA